MVLIPQVQRIRKASLYKTLWMNIPVVSGPDKSSRMRLQSFECLALTSGTFFFFLEVWYPSACYPGDSWLYRPPPVQWVTPDSTSDDSWLYRPGLWSCLRHGYHTHLTVSDTWGCRVAPQHRIQVLLVSAHIPMMKDPLPIILHNNSNYHKPRDGVLEISRILEIEHGAAFLFLAFLLR